MIWISTLCLLAVAAWLFFNALNEKRWVQAHSHDETVASDEGLLPNFSAITRTAQTHGDGKVSIGQENTRFSRTVAKVQEKTNHYGEKFVEARVAAARIDDPADRPASASEENTVFGRMVAKVGERTGRVDAYIEQKMKTASTAGGTADGAAQQEGTFFERASKKVAQKTDEISSSVATRARAAANNGDDGLFTKVVGKVSGHMDTVEQKVQQKLKSNKAVGNDEQSSDDMITRVSAKVDATVSDIDNSSASKGQKS